MSDVAASSLHMLRLLALLACNNGVSRRIDFNLALIHSNLICIAEDGGNLLEWDAYASIS